MLRTSKGKLVALLVALLTFCVAAPALTQAAYRPLSATLGRPPSDSVDRAVVLTLSKADRDEVSMARAALPTLKDPEVKRFAQLMIDDHNSALTSLTTIAGRLHFPLDHAGMPMTGMTPGTDAQFIEAQITGHRQLLGSLPTSDDQVQDQGLRSHLADTRRVVQSHLDKATLLQSRLAGTTP